MSREENYNEFNKGVGENHLAGRENSEKMVNKHAPLLGTWEYNFIFIFKALGRFLLILQVFFSAYLTISILLSTPNNRSLDVCLGNYEQYFSQTNGNKVCTRGLFIQRVICNISVMIHLILSSNIPEAVMLYFCFITINESTKKSLNLIGKKSYEIRKRYI